MKFVLFGMIGIVLSDIWIWMAYLRRHRSPLKWLHWLPLVLMACAIACGGASMAGWYTMTALITAVFIPRCVFSLTTALGRLAGMMMKPADKIGFRIGICTSSVILCMSLYGLIFGWRQVTAKNIELSFKNLPESFDGYRIAHLSDLHLGTFDLSPRTMSKITEKVNALAPDAILFTGDIVNLSPDEVEPFIKDISELKAPDGVYSVLGNHDYLDYVRYDTPDGQEKAIRRLIGIERSAGMDLLLNENRIIRHGDDSIAIVGVENDGLPPFPERGDLTKAQEGLPDGIFKILMSHDPTHWRRKVLPDSDIDLTLSGHTHAMQFRIGNFSPSMFIYKEWGGLYTEGDRKLYVSTGTGGNIAFRWGAWPEIDIITLRRAK